MTTIQDLQSLYDQGDFSKCLDSLSTFLLVNHDRMEALLLNAKCEFQIANQNPNQDRDDNLLFINAYNSFERALKLQPTNEEAMLYAAYINIYMTQVNLPEAKVYCDILALSENKDTWLKAIDYRRQVNFTLGNMDLVLEDIDLMINHYKELYPNNRYILDKELSLLYLEKTKIYLWHQVDALMVFQTFREGKEYPYDNYETHHAVALLALDYQELDLAGEAVYIAFQSNVDEPGQEWKDLYHRINELNKKGVLNKLMVHGLIIALRRFADYLKADAVEVLSLSLHYMKIYPEWDVLYHFAGAFLFEKEKYIEALPYLKKSLELGGNAYGLYRYIDASVRITGQLPAIASWPVDHPTSYYNAACFFNTQTIPEIRTEELAEELQKLKIKFYEVSYQGFYAYFHNNTGESLTRDPDIFAMCCNNYGIALTAIGAFEKAVEVHSIGYSFYPFWKQLSSWGTALKKLEKYEEAIEIFKFAATYSIDKLPFLDYLELIAEILGMTYKLGRTDKAYVLLEAITGEYDSFLDTNKDKLTEDELLKLSKQYVDIQNIRHHLLSKGSLEDIIKAWQNELVKNPDDSTAWFMLVQKYYLMEDCEQCIACTANYLAVKKGVISEENYCIIYFMRGLSYKKLGNYEKAIEDLKPLIALLKMVHPANESWLSKTCAELAHCYYMSEKWEACKEVAYQAILCYIRNKWIWNEELVKVKLLYADTLYKTGFKSEAISNIKNILKYYPDNEEALKREKEWKKGLFSFFK